MDELLVLLGLAVLAIPVTLVALLIAHVKLSKRVRMLEGVVDHLIAGHVAVAPGQAAPPDPSAPISEDEPRLNAPLPAKATAQTEFKGPWEASTDADRAPLPPRAPQPAPAPTPPKGPSVFARFGDWMRDNWFYAVSALSLVLAGVFLVQYGVENGLLPPTARVLAALLFGAALIGGGEWIRKRYGDGEDSATAYLPSVFSGAGLVTLFGAVLSARLLYNLIGVELAFAALVAVALGGVVLGWLHGPLLAAVGVIGAMLSPFLVGGSSDEVRWLFGYFLLVTVLGLSVDAIRRWAWVSGLTLVLAIGGGVILSAAPDTEPYFVGYMVALAILSVMIPGWRFWPGHDGPMLTEALARRAGRPYVATLIGWLTVAASVALIVISSEGGAAMDFWLAVAGLSVLALLLMTWASGARAVQDAAALPVIGLGVITFVWGFHRGALRAFEAERLPESAMPLEASYLVGIGVILSGLAAWRSFGAAQYRAVWAGAAALIAPVMALILEVTWSPSAVIGLYPWALHIAGLALMQVVLAERFARADGPDDRLRMSLSVLSALSLTAFFCVLLLSSAALTVALAVTVLVAALLDRRFNLPVMVLFVALGTVAIGWRLLVDPGLDWAYDGPFFSVVLAYGGAFATFVAGYIALRDSKGRDDALVWLDSAAWSTGGLFVSVMLYRAIASFVDGPVSDSHWALGLGAVIWLGVGLAQLQRGLEMERMRAVRLGLAAVFCAVAALSLGLALSEANPLFDNGERTKVVGPILVNSLAVAYLLPALVLGLGVWRIGLPVRMRRAGYATAGALTVLWGFGVIRHFWQGRDGMALGFGFDQPELYSYTVVLLILGVGLFYQSIARRSDLMRKAGLGVIGLAVAKVFFVDISGLDGLVRVFSLLGLGLVLAGLAWLNRWAKDKAEGALGRDDAGDGKGDA